MLNDPQHVHQYMVQINQCLYVSLITILNGHVNTQKYTMINIHSPFLQ